MLPEVVSRAPEPGAPEVARALAAHLQAEAARRRRAVPELLLLLLGVPLFAMVLWPALGATHGARATAAAYGLTAVWFLAERFAEARWERRRDRLLRTLRLRPRVHAHEEA